MPFGFAGSSRGGPDSGCKKRGHHRGSFATGGSSTEFCSASLRLVCSCLWLKLSCTLASLPSDLWAVEPAPIRARKARPVKCRLGPSQTSRPIHAGPRQTFRTSGTQNPAPTGSERPTPARAEHRPRKSKYDARNVRTLNVYVRFVLFTIDLGSLTLRSVRFFTTMRETLLSIGYAP